MPKSALRRRVAPFVPVLIEYEDENGPFSKLYRLAFNLNVLAEISEKTGLQALTFDMWTRLSASILRVMFWSALIPHQPEFDNAEGFEVAGSMLNGESQESVVKALWEAYLLYLPKDEAELLRQKRKEALEGESDPLEIPAPMTKPASEAGSSSGVSADTTYESPIAQSAS